VSAAEVLQYTHEFVATLDSAAMRHYDEEKINEKNEKATSVSTQPREPAAMSTSPAPVKETFFAPEALKAGQIYDFMEAHTERTGAAPRPQFFLSGSAAGDQVEIPSEIYDVLVKAVEAMRKGLAVTITPSSMTLTTQQAAELLGVTRPTLVKLLDAGKIPFEKPATHRRVRLEDVLAFKNERKAEQHAALASLGAIDDEDPATLIEDLKYARAEAGRRRRARQK
jgi:excisionase family DNA binding protein